ncbi:hypothetical protein VT84_32105 [Gemmata sp. SH-PL17]|nr:hypothetical protein VT84_32105 [Gemmata sp. SH-PL17]
MSNGSVLELETLPAIHPRCGLALLEQCATSAILRLSLDPTALPPGTMNRAVAVDWLARPGSGAAVQETRGVGWNGLVKFAGDLAVQWNVAVPPQDITEQAAIAVMALLIHNLARGEILRVLPIGSGGDYSVQVSGLKRPIQAESSGIRSDPSGSQSRARLGQKKLQVLTVCRAGFAAVTTFAHAPGANVHSYLHYVCKKPRKRKKKRNKKANP